MHFPAFRNVSTRQSNSFFGDIAILQISSVPDPSFGNRAGCSAIASMSLNTIGQ